MHHRKRVVSEHEDAVLERTRRDFQEIYGAEAAAARERAIAALPAVEWRGRTLRTVRCQGAFGRGPHDVNLPESVLWALFDFRGFLCAFHR